MVLLRCLLPFFESKSLKFARFFLFAIRPVVRIGQYRGIDFKDTEFFCKNKSEQCKNMAQNFEIYRFFDKKNENSRAAIIFCSIVYAEKRLSSVITSN